VAVFVVGVQRRNHAHAGDPEQETDGQARETEGQTALHG
jgi:hypothetical protein